jgi:hypothetical protein
MQKQRLFVRHITAEEGIYLQAELPQPIATIIQLVAQVRPRLDHTQSKQGKCTRAHESRQEGNESEAHNSSTAKRCVCILQGNFTRLHSSQLRAAWATYHLIIGRLCYRLLQSYMCFSVQ